MSNFSSVLSPKSISIRPSTMSTCTRNVAWESVLSSNSIGGVNFDNSASFEDSEGWRKTQWVPPVDLALSWSRRAESDKRGQRQEKWRRDMTRSCVCRRSPCCGQTWKQSRPTTSAWNEDQTTPFEPLGPTGDTDIDTVWCRPITPIKLLSAGNSTKQLVQLFTREHRPDCLVLEIDAEHRP